MKLLRTIEKIVSESERAYEDACERGAKPQVIDKLEKNYLDSLKLMSLYENVEKNNDQQGKTS
jgi:hypothetical protein